MLAGMPLLCGRARYDPPHIRHPDNTRNRWRIILRVSNVDGDHEMVGDEMRNETMNDSNGRFSIGTLRGGFLSSPDKIRKHLYAMRASGYNVRFTESPGFCKHAFTVYGDNEAQKAFYFLARLLGVTMGGQKMYQANYALLDEIEKTGVTR